METAILSIDDPQSIKAAVQTLQRGGLVAFPTDTVYGLAADLNSTAAISQLFTVKGRDINKAIAVLIGSVEQLDSITPDFSLPARALAARYWPGALTLVVSKQPQLPDVLSNLKTIGVRMPDHSFALRLLKMSGPLAVTSANRSSSENPLSAEDVLLQLGGLVDLILDGGRSQGGVPSTVVDCTVPDTRILRQGAITAAEIRAVLGN